MLKRLLTHYIYSNPYFPNPNKKFYLRPTSFYHSTLELRDFSKRPPAFANILDHMKVFLNADYESPHMTLG